MTTDGLDGLTCLWDYLGKCGGHWRGRHGAVLRPHRGVSRRGGGGRGHGHASLLLILPKHLLVVVNAQLNQHVHCGHVVVELAGVHVRRCSGQGGAEHQRQVGRGHLVLGTVLGHSGGGDSEHV